MKQSSPIKTCFHHSQLMTGKTRHTLMFTLLQKAQYMGINRIFQTTTHCEVKGYF